MTATSPGSSPATATKRRPSARCTSIPSAPRSASRTSSSTTATSTTPAGATTTSTRIDDYLPWLRQQLGRDADYFDHGVNCNSWVARPWDKPEDLHPTNLVVTQSIGFLRRRDPRKPFFLFMSFHRPHPPYDPPAWAFEQYLSEPMPTCRSATGQERSRDRADPRRPDALVGEIDPRTPPASPGRLLRAHDPHRPPDQPLPRGRSHEYGLRDNTYICFTSDHGEMLGDHHLFRKAYPVRRLGAGAADPQGAAGQRDRRGRAGRLRGRAARRHADPARLRWAADTRAVEGRSFLPIARGEQAEWRPYLHGEHTIFDQSAQWLTDGHEKYVWYSGTGVEQLFDLDDDPRELRRPGEEVRPGRSGRALARAADRGAGRARGGLHGRKGPDRRPPGRSRPVARALAVIASQAGPALVRTCGELPCSRLVIVVDSS